MTASVTESVTASESVTDGVTSNEKFVLQPYSSALSILSHRIVQ